MLKASNQGKSTTEVKVLTNWLDEVRRRVPTK
jgi:hypothetical protein